jgi:hypothetical protein
MQGEAQAAAASDPAPPEDAFEAAFAELQKWVDTAEEKYALLHAKRLARRGRLAAALKCASFCHLTLPCGASAYCVQHLWHAPGSPVLCMCACMRAACDDL